MDGAPNLFIDLAPAEVARLDGVAQSRGISVDALVNEIIGNYLDHHSLSPDEERELSVMRQTDRRYDWDLHEAMATADPPPARDAAE